MMDYWFNFAVKHARTLEEWGAIGKFLNDPNVGVNVNGTEWPTASETENILILDEEISTASISSDRVDICALFDSIGYVAPYQYPYVESTTTTPEPSDGDAKEDDDGGLKSGTVVLIVLGILVGLLIIGCLIYLACQRAWVQVIP